MTSISFLDIARWYEPLFGRVLAGLRALGVKMAPPKRGMRVLDVGCGTGMQLAYYKEGSCETFGVDLSSSMLQVANMNLDHCEGLITGDAVELPFKEGVFDLVLSSLFLHQLDTGSRSTVLNEVRRVLRPEGKILLTDFHPESIDSAQGVITKFLISAVELAAGWRHYSNSRDFLSRGGIPSLAAKHDYMVRKKFVVGNGNLGIYLLQRAYTK